MVSDNARATVTAQQRTLPCIATSLACGKFLARVWVRVRVCASLPVRFPSKDRIVPLFGVRLVASSRAGWLARLELLDWSKSARVASGTAGLRFWVAHPECLRIAYLPIHISLSLYLSISIFLLRARACCAVVRRTAARGRGTQRQPTTGKRSVMQLRWMELVGAYIGRWCKAPSCGVRPPLRLYAHSYVTG